jgi:hypothetical protein
MKIEFYTDSVKDKNEDIYGVTRYGAFVLDGAAALINKSYTPGGNDVHWMVNWWKDYLELELDNLDKDIKEILQKGIEAFNQEYGKYTQIDRISGLEQISAGIALVRNRGDDFECYVLGDVEITIENSDGVVDIITDSSLKHMDKKVIDMMCGEDDREGRIIFKGYTKEELELLKKHRMKMNVNGGYYILGHCVEAIKKGIYKVYPIAELKRCLLSTDGINPLDTYYSRGRLLDEMSKRGVKGLISELRSFEKTDTEKKKIKRLKIHDDATAVLLGFHSKLS